MKRLSTMGENVILSPLRLLKVPGFEERKNDIVYCRPQHRSEGKDLVVFFGGDVQVRYIL